MFIPKPIDTTEVEIPLGIEQLIECLSKNTHEVWARQRMNDGWKYGPVRSDEKKEHPCLIPYEKLPEKEKEYDRVVSTEVIKTIIALGFRIEK